MANSTNDTGQTEALQANLRTLVHRFVPTLLQALREASTDLAMANDRKMLFVVSEALSPLRQPPQVTLPYLPSWTSTPSAWSMKPRQTARSKSHAPSK